MQSQDDVWRTDEDGKGSSRSLGVGCDIVLETGDGGFDWVEAIALISFWVDDAKKQQASWGH